MRVRDLLHYLVEGTYVLISNVNTAQAYADGYINEVRLDTQAFTLRQIFNAEVKEIEVSNVDKIIIRINL